MAVVTGLLSGALAIELRRGEHPRLMPHSHRVRGVPATALDGSRDPIATATDARRYTMIRFRTA